jgi:nucleoid DNA-binding protein
MVDEDALETFLQALSRLRGNRRIVLPGVGSFTVRQYRAQEGRNPRTGELVWVPETRLLFFAADQELCRALEGLPPSAAKSGNVIARPVAEALGGAIRSRLLAGDAAEIPGLGVFDIVEKPARDGANPETGEPIIVPARRMVVFRLADAMRDRLNPAR